MSFYAKNAYKIVQDRQIKKTSKKESTFWRLFVFLKKNNQLLIFVVFISKIKGNRESKGVF